MAEMKNIEQLPDFVRLDIERYAQRLVEVHQDNVITIAVYGSAASGNFIPKRSDVNVVVVVKNLAFSVLKSSLKLVQDGRRKNINAPLFLTEDYIARSLDVFPIEFLDIKDHHVVIYGQDLFKDLAVDTAHLRIFCEQQIKGKLLHIRQAYLETGLNTDAKIALLYHSLNAFIPIFGNLLRLRGRPVPSSKMEIVKSVSREFHVDDTAMLAVYQSRQSGQKMGAPQTDEYLENFIHQLEKLAVTLDQ